MTTCKDIFSFLNSFAPVSEQEAFDNVGFLFGDILKEVRTVLLALDCTSEVVEEASRKQAQLIVTHHPLIFHPLKSVTPDDPTGKKVLALAKNGICVLSMHTNLDKAAGGVNDALLLRLGGRDPEPVPENPYLRIGHLEKPCSLPDYLKSVKRALSADGLRYHDAGKEVYRIACSGGAGGKGLSAAFAKHCDTFITSDITYSVFLDAKEYGMNLIDADHFCTENPVIPVLQFMLKGRFPETEFLVSEALRQTARFFC